MIEDHDNVKLIEKYKLEPNSNIMVLEKKAPAKPEKKDIAQQNIPLNDPNPQINNNPNPNQNQQPAHQPFQVDEQKITNMIELGFTREEIIPALTVARNDVNLAYEFLESGIPED